MDKKIFLLLIANFFLNYAQDLQVAFPSCDTPAWHTKNSRITAALKYTEQEYKNPFTGNTQKWLTMYVFAYQNKTKEIILKSDVTTIIQNYGGGQYTYKIDTAKIPSEEWVGLDKIYDNKLHYILNIMPNET